MIRHLYHVLHEHEAEGLGGGDYHPASLDREGFIHTSYKDAVIESARLYFAPDARLKVLVIDPRLLTTVRVEIAQTPRGPMPHVHGPIPSAAIVGVIDLDRLDEHEP